jgi:hypothetical protein
MENLVNKFRAEVDSFLSDVQSQMEKGNQTAGTRARKMSVVMEKTLKEIRKKSLDARPKKD